MKQRIDKPELIDLGPAYYSDNEYTAWLIQMERIGRLLGSNKATLNAFKNLKSRPKSILDVGCGGGDFTYLLAQEFSHASVLGIDISEPAINYARKNKAQNIAFELRKKPELDEPLGSFDVVTSTLVCHHLSDTQIIDFLKRAKVVARQAIIINDLHRHWLAYYGFKIISRAFFHNRLIIHDGPLSIARAFTYSDWKKYLEAAGFYATQYKISWHWLFRWIVVVELI